MSTGWHRDRGGRVRVWAVSVLKSDSAANRTVQNATRTNEQCLCTLMQHAVTKNMTRCMLSTSAQPICNDSGCKMLDATQEHALAVTVGDVA